MIRLLDSEIKKIKEIENITTTNYEIRNNAIDEIKMLNALLELFDEYNKLQNKFLEYEQNINDNYKQITKEEQYEYGD